MNFTKKFNRSKGITLIALVVTIIVLLILAGVSINMLTGQNGILKNASKAKNETEEAQTKELVKLAVMSSIGTDGLIDLNQLKTEIESQGGRVTGTTFPVTITIGNTSYQVDQYGNITEPSTVPQISYTVTNTDGTEITNSNLPESAKLNITITNISELTVTSIKIKKASGTEITGATIDLSKGTASAEITENGKYVVEIVATDKKGKNASASPEVTVSGKIKVANFEAYWTTADSTNSNDDWYAYKDNAGTKAQVNAPKLADGMTAIKYSTDSELTAGSKWANAMTKDGSMWVWIPRYAYKITYKSSNKSEGGTIDIAFLKGATNEFLDDKLKGQAITTNISEVKYTDNANGTKSQNKWLLEPAFTFGTENIEGFWFAKFEASPVGATAEGEAQTSDKTKIMQIKPNKYSWRNIASVDIFEYCLNLKNMTSNNELVYFNNVNNVDTHMTKNVEWGAVAYLAHSKYGLNGQEICINTENYFLTGEGSGSAIYESAATDKYNTAKGVTASTTKNVYGIYDMSGGADEYVAACYKGCTNNLTSTDVYISKYIDVYDEYGSSKYGDAVFETSSSSSGATSWFSDLSRFVSSSKKIFVRGGSKNIVNGSNAGLFHFNYDYFGGGQRDSNIGFRPVCVVK